MTGGCRSQREADELAEVIHGQVKPEMVVSVLPLWFVSVYDPLTERETRVGSEREWDMAKHLPVALFPMSAAPQAEGGEK